MLVFVSFGIPALIFFAGLCIMIRSEMRSSQPKLDSVHRIFLKERPKKTRNP